MESISFYDAQGRFTSTVTGDPAMMAVNRAHARDPFVEGDFVTQDKYVVGGVVADRPTMALTVEGHTITNLPNPCTVYVNGRSYPCQDTRVELSFSQPGTYTVRIEAWPYMDKEITIENPSR